MDVSPHAETVALLALQSCRAPVAYNDFTSTPDKYIHCQPLTCQKNDRNGFSLQLVPHGCEKRTEKEIK